jgi:hypothetical protein
MTKTYNKSHENLLFPSLLVTMILVNQYNTGAIFLGQLFGWLSYLFAGILLYNSFKNKLGLFFLLLMIIGTKIIGHFDRYDIIDILYLFFRNSLFCLAGMILVYKNGALIYKQIIIFCFINLFFMILQVSGIGGSISMILTTHGEGNFTTPFFSLFKNKNEFQYLLVQGRPSGITQANIILSLLSMFCVVIHLTYEKKVYKYGSWLISSIVVLSMAKKAFLGTLITSIIIFILGNSGLKKRALNFICITIVLILLYFFLFPGLASVNLAKETINASIFLRANEIMSVLNPDLFLIEDKKPFFEGTQMFSFGKEGEFVSGYAILISRVYNHFVIILFLILFAFFIYKIGINKIKLIDRKNSLTIITIFLVISLFPFTHPVWPFQIYWFLLGYGLLPFVVLFDPKFFKTTLL